MFRTPFDKAIERVNELTEAIADQQELVANTAALIEKVFDSDVIRFRGDLQKLSGATDFGKNLNSCLDLIAKGHEQLAKLKQLMTDCRQAQERAGAAFADYVPYVTNGKPDVGSRSFSIATKNAGEATPFELAKREPSPLASLSATQLAHRHNPRGE